jgi:hypothetical protein
MEQEEFPGYEENQQEEDEEYQFKLEEGEHIVGQIGIDEMSVLEQTGIKLTLSREDNQEEGGDFDEKKNSFTDIIHRVLFTNKRMVCFLGGLNTCTICTSADAQENKYCTRGLYAEYFNCTTHGASAEEKTFMVTMSDVVLAEQLEMNPAKDCTENIEEAEEAFNDILANEQYVVGLLGEFSLLFQCSQAKTTARLYELFGQGNVLCDDPEEIGGGLLEDMEEDDEYAGMTEEEIELRMVEDMKQAAEELVNDQAVIKKRDPHKPAQLMGEAELSQVGDDTQMKVEQT